MTEQLTRPVPTPPNRSRVPLPAPPPAAASGPYFDRYRWEEALLATPLEHHAARLLGWGLAHLAGNAGYLPAGTTHAQRLAQKTRLTAKQVRLSLQQLQQAGLISRPAIETWEPKTLVRPIMLTLPSADVALRQEPPSTGEDR